MPVGLLRKTMLDSIEGVEPVFIDDSHAECTVSPPTPMKLRKFADGWKVDFTGPESERLLELAPVTFDSTTRMFDEVRTDIINKSITSRDEARNELKRLKATYGL